MINIEIDIKENNMSENQTYTPFSHETSCPKKGTEHRVPKGVEETKALGKDVLLVEDGEFKFYFRQPSPVEGMYFLDSAGKNSTITKSKEKFIRGLFIGENVSEFDKFLNEKPFAFDKIVFILSKTLGSNVNFTVAKI